MANIKPGRRPCRLKHSELHSPIFTLVACLNACQVIVSGDVPAEVFRPVVDHRGFSAFERDEFWSGAAEEVPPETKQRRAVIRETFLLNSVELTNF